MVVVREWVETDLDAVVMLRLENARVHAEADPLRHRIPDEVAVRGEVRRMLRSATARAHVLVADVDGSVVGTAELIPAAGPRPDQILTDRRRAQVHVVIADGRRGSGVGRALVDAARTLAARHGIEELIAPVLVANHDALRFYERLGFTTHGVLMSRATLDPRRS